MTVAHYLTFFRILISPLFLIIYLEHDYLGISSVTLPFVLLALLCVSELTDAFDGHLARRFNQVTDLGKLIDPMADSINHLSIFLTFTADPVGIPMIVVFLFIYRDSVISTLRTVCALKGVALAARPSGKIKAVVQAIAAITIVLLMIPHSRGELSGAMLHDLSTGIVAVAAGYTLFSAIDYIFANRRYIAKFFISRPVESL